MKKNLYKIFAALVLLFATLNSRAQVSVTFVVDMTTFVGVVDTNGIHIAGSFVTNVDPAIVAGTTDTLSDWSPGAVGSALTNIAGNIWATTIVFSSAHVGDSVFFKYLNGNDWGVGGPNTEGQSGTTLLTSACGHGDGYGGFNRAVGIPTANGIYAAPWDACGIMVLTGIHEVQNGVASLDLYPNPAPNFTQITYGLNVNDNVTLTLRSTTGQVLRTLVNKVQSPGLYTYDLRTDDLPNGMYFVQINVDGFLFVKRFVVNQ